MASEGKQRSLMKSQLSELPVEGESVPFAFNLKRGGYELRPAPLAYVNDLQSMLFHLLEEKQRYVLQIQFDLNVSTCTVHVD